MHVLVTLQTFADLPDDAAQKLVCRVPDLEVFLHTEFERQFDEIQRKPHDLVGKKSGMLRQELHATLHDTSIVDLVNRPYYRLEDQE